MAQAGVSVLGRDGVDVGPGSEAMKEPMKTKNTVHNCGKDLVGGRLCGIVKVKA